MLSNVEIRKVFGETLAEMMRKDDRIVVIDADLGKANGTFSLKQEFPLRALNTGVQEANMTGVAAGLASYGFIPVISSFAPFASRRVCDQIAISICYANQNVKIVGSDPGITAEYNGGTHMGLDDVGTLRSLPGLTIVEPSDAMEMKCALPKIIAHEGAVYIRMSRKVVPVVYPEPFEFDLFKADVLKEGKDISIIACGMTVSIALDTQRLLAEKGIKAEIINAHTIKPLDAETIVKSAKKTGKVLVIENHNVIGGLTSAVSEVLCREHPVRVASIAVNDRFGIVGKLGELKEYYGFTPENAVDVAEKLIKSN